MVKSPGQNLTHSKITLKGRIPSKKNSRCLFVRRGKLFNIPSKAYSEWHKEASAQLCSFVGSLKDIVFIQLDFYATDKRSSDLTNKSESVMDLLVDNGILEDDNWWVISKIGLNFLGVDKLNPRCEIHIYSNDNGQNRFQ